MSKRVDSNHWEVCRAFRQLGWCVASTADLGGGFPDVVVAKRGVLRLIEVKDGTKPPSKRALTPLEAVYHRDMAAAGCPITIIESVQQVIDLDRELS